jgi:ABC-type nitrate/sulfonate/bicarbonate transport system substrate-binding protein
MRAQVLAPLIGAFLLAACGGTRPAPAASSAGPSGPASAPARSAGSVEPKPSLITTKPSGGDPNGYPIKIGFASPAVASWSFYAAFAQNYFAREHLNVTMIQMPGNVAITALSKSEIDFTNSPGNAIEGATRGLPFKMVLSAWSRTPWIVMGKPEYKSLKDLKGHLLGTNQVGSSPYLHLQAALRREGMTVNDLQIVSSPGTQDTFGQLLAGRIDAAVLSPPFDVQAEERGFHEVAFIGDALQQPYTGLGTNTMFLSQHRPQVVAAIKALMDGTAWLKANPEGAADLIVKNLNTTPEVARRVTEKMLPFLSDTGEHPMAGVEEAIAIQAELTKQPIAVKAEDIVDWSPLHEALGKR